MKKLIGICLVIGLVLVCLIGCTAQTETPAPAGDAAPAAAEPAPAAAEPAPAEAAPAEAEPAAADGEAPTYFINPKQLGPAYWSASEKGALQAGEELGVDVIFNAGNDADSAKQISMINDMIVAGVDGMAIASNDANAVVPVIEKAQEAGIDVITWDSDAFDSTRSWYVVAEDDVNLAEAYVEQMAQEIGGAGKIVFMISQFGAQNQIVKVDAGKAYLAENYPDIEVVDVLASNEEQSKAFENAQNSISSHPDLAGIVSFAGAESPAAGEAIQEAIDKGLIEPDQIALTGFGLPSLMRDYVKSGIVKKFIVWDPSKLGYAAVSVLNEMGKGTDIATLTELEGVGPVRVDPDLKHVYTGFVEITADNVDDFDF